ncbi:MAG: FkbM family methyltransferase [Nitrospira sp.]|nr:FkbM family methyltransferase [Nitrospira sp.]
MKKMNQFIKNISTELVRFIAPGVLWQRKFQNLTRARHEIELNLLPALSDRAKTSIDIGAAAGVFSASLLPMSRDCVAFEPRPAQAADMRAMFESVGASVRVESVALSDQTGTMPLRILVEDQGRSTIEADNYLEDEDGSAREEIQVPVCRLDDYGFDGVGFIKIDVEGHELSVLKGARATIVREQPTLLVEIENRHKPNAVADVTAFLRGLGYTGFFLLENSVQPMAEFVVANHQNPANIGGWKSQWKRLGVYVNNFIFLPRGREHILREAVSAGRVGLA